MKLCILSVSLFKNIKFIMAISLVACFLALDAVAYLEVKSNVLDLKDAEIGDDFFVTEVTFTNTGSGSHLTIKNSSNGAINPINFKDGISIFTDGSLIAEKTNTALLIESSNKPIIKGYIENYGLIDASNTSVRIGSTTAGTVFPLVSDTANNSYFYNYGRIGDNTAFDIQGPSGSEHVFNLVNHKFVRSLIAGNFKTKNVKFRITNHYLIGIYGTKKAMDITSYTGEYGSGLIIGFIAGLKNQNLNSNNAIISASDYIKFNKNSYLLLACSGTLALNAKATGVPLISAPKIELPLGGIEDILYTKFIKISNNKFHFIQATNVTIKNNKIIADLSIVQNASITDDIIPYLPTKLPGIDIDKHLEKKLPIATEIKKQITENKVLKGVLIDHTIAEYSNKVKKDNGIIDEVARDNNNSANEYFDHIMPDTSNKSVATNVIVADKVMEQINTRIARTGLVAARYTLAHKQKNSRDYQGVATGDIYKSFSLWGNIGIHGTNEKPHNNNSYSKIRNLIFSLGADTVLYNDLILGISYGYSNAKVDVLGGNSSTKIGTEKITTHILGTYSTMGFQIIDAELSFMFGFSNHKPNDTLHGDLDSYKSNLICINTTVIYPLDIIYNVDIAVQLGLTRVNVDEHQNKFSALAKNNKKFKNSKKVKNLEKKQSRNIIGIGISSATYDSFPISDKVDMDYRLSVGYKFNITGKDEVDVYLDTDAVSKVKVKNRNPGGHSINFDTDLNFKVYKNIKLSIDAYYRLGMAPSRNSYGTNLNIGYLF